VFKLEANGKETVLHHFADTPGDGSYPYATVVLDSSGNIYGTTQNGGHVAGNRSYSGCGVVFKLDTGNNQSLPRASPD
jgi:hypothetical protein